MSSKTALKIAVLAEWLLIVASVVLSLVLEARLPEPLQAWIESEVEAPLTTTDIVLMALSLLVFCASLVSSVGLLLLQRWARWVYLTATAIGYATLPFSGPTVEHALADALDDLSGICCGLVLALAFCSDALEASPDGTTGDTPQLPET